MTFTEGLIKTLILRYSLPGVFCPCFLVTAQMVCHFAYGILLSNPIIFLPPHTMSIHHCKAKCCHRHITNAAKSVQTGTYILKQTGPLDVYYMSDSLSGGGVWHRVASVER